MQNRTDHRTTTPSWNLAPGATDAEIKRAWHEQMQVWHPDRFVHSPTLHRKAEARTQLINQAYQTLSDPTARARYDAEQTTSLISGASPTAPFSGGPSATGRTRPARNCAGRKRC
jgi:curved DNA-binding protein CbpA